jgi:hypothetical protein
MRRIGARKQKKFLERIRDGETVTDAAKAAGINRQYLYELRDADHDFRQQWARADRMYLDALADELVTMTRADKSPMMMLRILERRHPDWSRDQDLKDLEQRIAELERTRTYAAPTNAA